MDEKLLDLLRRIVNEAVDRVDEESRPSGHYREDGWLPIGDDRRVSMPKAKREHVQAWAAIDPDPANQRYAAERFAVWKPEHRTLAEVEKSLAAN
jgi:hypothetical protein